MEITVRLFQRYLPFLFSFLFIAPHIHGWTLHLDYKAPNIHLSEASTSRVDRRDAINQLFLLATVTASRPVLAASTSSSVPTKQELSRLQVGHARVQYLLQHWNDITRVCGTAIMSDTERRQVIRTEGGGGTDACEKTPLRVQEYMGYKSTTDPLYKADKLLVRAGALVDPDNFENYLDVVEKYREKADQTALLAYTSSWGEFNP
jgi:hypothetical protein